MSGNVFGKSFQIITFGESHGKAVGVVIDGVQAGLRIGEDDIQKELDRRRPGQSAVTTPRKEEDKVEILSGVFEGKTTGAPIAMLVWNKGMDSSKYEKIKDLFRPGQADFTYFKKFGFRDYRGGGRASGRETIARVAGGAVAKKILAKKGISVVGYSTEIGGIKAKKFDEQEIERNSVRCADKQAAAKMEKAILAAKAKGDSVGGIVEIVARNVPAGLGEPVFGKLGAEIAKALMSIGAVKGVEIGAGFAAARMKGSECNDAMRSSGGKVAFKSNNAGGILGGISTGQEIVARIAVKPTPSISIPQKTVDIHGKNSAIKIKGMHDPCICPRVVPVAEAMVALVLADALLTQQARGKY
ncbi:MAG: chorismate synthase [Candidatus Diapherotrites archaeon]|nr:chorismate synthase [Candidatus Diapherotrites archaeon]